MSLQLTLATTPGQLIGTLSISLEGGPIGATLAFGPPGTTISTDLDIPPGTTPFALSVYYFVDNDRAYVRITNVADGDIFSVTAVPPSFTAPNPSVAPVLLLGNLWHSAGPPTQGYCIITCQDGTSNECCVVCRTGRAVTKTCC
jgi:hypothetical protein